MILEEVHINMLSFFKLNELYPLPNCSVLELSLSSYAFLEIESDIALTLYSKTISQMAEKSKLRKTPYPFL